MNSALLACSVGDIALLKRCLLSHTSPSATNKEVYIQLSVIFGKALSLARDCVTAGTKLPTPGS